MIRKEPRGHIVDPKVAIVDLPLFWIRSVGIRLNFVRSRFSMPKGMFEKLTLCHFGKPLLVQHQPQSC